MSEQKEYSELQKLMAEAVGTAILLATIVGAGIMADSLSGGNAGVALLTDTLPIGAVLVVIIMMFGPISGAHFNPAVTLIFTLKGDITPKLAARYVVIQIIGAILGVWAAHYMFGLDVVQTATNIRTGTNLWFAEVIATFGLIVTVLFILKYRAEFVPQAVGLYIFAACWFTASTSFANPAVTIARSFSDTYTGITPEHAPAFIVAQIIGAITGLVFARYMLKARG